MREGICRAAIYLSILYWLGVLCTIAWMVSNPPYGPGLGPGFGGPYPAPFAPEFPPPYPWPGPFPYFPPIDPLGFFFGALIFYLLCFGAFWVICGFFTWGYIEPVIRHEHKHKYECGGRCGGTC
jgi:hypothetical protein